MLFQLPSGQWDAQLSGVAATGVGTVRFDTEWSRVEVSPPVGGVHRYDWSALDLKFAALARQHLQGLPIIDYSTPWAASNPAATPPEVSPPADPSTYAAFAGALAGRYGSNGSFWTANPGLPSLPATQFEVWNEPNSEQFFQGADPAAYAALYAGARAAIHAVDARATVMVGGLVPTLGPIVWLEGVIAALPAHGREIDAVAWHPYYTTAGEVYASLRSLHATLTAHGLHPPISLTEVNYLGGTWSPSLLGKLARTLPRSNCGISGMIVHTWSSLPPPAPPDPFAIADPSGSLNSGGLAFASAVQRATTIGVRRPPPICKSLDDTRPVTAPARPFRIRERVAV